LEGRRRTCHLQRCVANLCVAFNEDYSLTFDPPLFIALFSMIAFSIVSDVYRTSGIPDFAFVHPGMRLLCPLLSSRSLMLFPSQARRGTSTCYHGSSAFSLYLGSSGLARRLIRVKSGLLATALIFVLETAMRECQGYSLRCDLYAMPFNAS
jgi:hypothetical protein